MNNKRIGILYGVLSALCYSTRSPLAKFALLSGCGVRELAALRMLFTSLLFLAAGLFSRRDEADTVVLRREWRAWLGGLMFAASTLFSFYAVSLIGVALSVVLMYMHPAFVAIISRVFLGERQGAWRWVAYASAYAGLFLVFVPGLSGAGGGGLAVGAAVGLLAALSYAVYQLLTQSLSARVSSLRLGTFTSFVSLVPMLLLWHFSPPTVPFTALLWIGALALLATFIPMYLVIASISRVGATTTSLLALISPFAALAMAALFFDERLHGVQWLGAGVVIASLGVSLTLPKPVSQKLPL